MKRTVKQLMAVLLLALLLGDTAHAASPFPDVSGNASYAEAVEYLNDIGVMQGDGNGNFNPDKSVSRAEMAAIICRVIGETENLSTASTFTDVPVSHWANTFIMMGGFHAAIRNGRILFPTMTANIILLNATLD